MRIYLGDGVYGLYTGDEIILTTENGVEVTNTIVFDNEVLGNFLNWIDSLRANKEVQL